MYPGILKVICYFLISSTSLAGLTACGQSSPTPFAQPLPQMKDSLQVSILIDKSDYTLAILYKGEPVKTYPCVLGPDPVNDKRREGDGCTPEGKFKIRDKYPHAKWNYFLWVDYPTDESRKKHDAAKRAGTIPRDAKIGGEIGIHGVPADRDDLISDKVNWTLGCISVSNEAIAEIYRAVPSGATVVIRP